LRTTVAVLARAGRSTTLQIAPKMLACHESRAVRETL
jgi:hypothetical protein